MIISSWFEFSEALLDVCLLLHIFSVHIVSLSMAAQLMGLWVGWMASIGMAGE